MPADLVRACLAELVADEGVVREPVPNPASEGGTIPAVYLVPFHRAETALAAALLRLSTAPADRMPAFGDVDWDKALAWLRGRTGAELAPEQEQAVRLALTQRGRGADRRAGLRQVLHRQIGDHAGPRRRRPRSCWPRRPGGRPSGWPS